jgi:hypothetical protein
MPVARLIRERDEPRRRAREQIEIPILASHHFLGSAG